MENISEIIDGKHLCKAWRENINENIDEKH